MSIRTKIIQKIIHINEAIFFYPKLKKFYKKKLNKSECFIIDVGANKGQSIDFFLNINPYAKIHSFEPNKNLFNYLQKKYILFSNVTIHNLGLSDINGELMFHENIMDETSTFESLNFESKYLERKAKVLGVSTSDIIINKYKVEVLRLIDFINKHSNIFFDVLKIDVEGHELNCLKGLFTNQNEKLPIRYIQLESHNDDMYKNNNQHTEIENILNTNGFKKIAEIKHGFGDFCELIFENNNSK